jgi:hypothetical protein
MINVVEEMDVTSTEKGTNNEKIKMIDETMNENSSAVNRNKTFFCIIAAAAERSAEQEARRNQFIQTNPLKN